MAVVWSAICALSALAAGMQHAQAGDAPQMRTKSLPGYGYIRYEVLPGDDQVEPGELIVVHEDRRPAPQQTEASAPEPAPAPATSPRGQSACAGLRAKLLARLMQVQGLDVQPEVAEWLERNLAMGTRDVNTIQLFAGQPLLVTALQVDGVARSLAEELAACEKK
jgi:hypothetical protein